MRMYIELSTNLPKWQQYVMRFFALNTLYSFILVLFGSYFSELFVQSQEFIILAIFIVEYVFRIYISKRKIRYILSLYGIIDLIACFPLLAPIFKNLQFVQLFEGLQVLSGLRVLKFIRLIRAIKSSTPPRKSDRLIFDAIRQEQELLIKTAGIILSLAITGAILVFTVEHAVQPHRFGNIFDAFWWAFITFTTVGYGDIYPITVFGRIIAMALSVLGIAMFAIPTTVISSSLINRLNRESRTGQVATLSQKLLELELLLSEERLTDSEYQQLRQKLLDTYE